MNWLTIRRTRRDKPSEEGYVLLTFALFLVPLMTFAGFSVDVGSWYARSMQIQRAADAAALAGVVWMPNLTNATTAAQAAATKNGFTNGANNITVQVSGVQGSDEKIQVKITDANVPRFFSKMILSNETIARTATAQYLLPLPLGSPKNTLGTGDIFSGSNRDNMWAAVNGYCAGRESGDLLLAHDDRTASGGFYNCPGLITNPDYQSSGYFYTVDVPSSASGTLNLYLFDPAFDGGRGDATLQNGATVTTTFVLYAPGPNLTQIPSGGATLRTTTYNSGDTTYRNVWHNFYSGVVSPGRYFLQVYTTANQANSFGSNGFAIEAIIGSTSPGNGTAGSGAGACTTISGMPGYSASCPQVHGVDHMSVFANISGATADFYLAQVDAVYAGKKMIIDLFDAGEGASTLQILDPNGNPATFTWSIDCSGVAAPTGGCSGSSTSTLNVSGAGTQPFSTLLGTARYNDRTVRITVDLPTNYTGTYGANEWWKVRYATATAPTDRTTWSANITGNPVHLTDD